MRRASLPFPLSPLLLLSISAGCRSYGKQYLLVLDRTPILRRPRPSDDDISCFLDGGGGAAPSLRILLTPSPSLSSRQVGSSSLRVPDCIWDFLVGSMPSINGAAQRIVSVSRSLSPCSCTKYKKEEGEARCYLPGSLPPLVIVG